jgi:recombination protein RecA
MAALRVDRSRGEEYGEHDGRIKSEYRTATMQALMGGTAAIRDGLGAAKVGRGLEGFSARLREPVELQPCGIAELDELLGGGFPRGALVEVCGARSSGRTSLSLALLAEATRRQEACAFVDVSDELDPMSVAAAGVDARRLLWVRCGGEVGAVEKLEFRGKAGIEEGRGKPLSYSGEITSNRKDGAGQGFPVQEKPHGFAWTHPRDAMRGVETSIPGLMRRPSKAPSYEEMSFAVRCAGEQVEPDRQPPRRGENLQRRLFQREEPSLKKREWGTSGDAAANAFAKSKSSAWVRVNAKPWKRLEQALKATDLLLHSGGWGVVVVDLGGISWVEARRIPMHTWFRFRRVVENSPTILLVLGEESCAKSCASLVLECRRMGEKWSTALGSATSDETKLGLATLQGFEMQGEIACSRMQRLEVQAARWQTRTFLEQ